MTTIAIARIKKPHRHFKVGDLVVGEIRDGMADNLVCWGWSSKHRRMVGGKHGYRLRYCGWERMPRRWGKAAENAKFEEPHRFTGIAPTGSGHLRIVKWFRDFEGGLPGDPRYQLRDDEWLMRLVSDLSCGNMPLSREESAHSALTLPNRRL